MNEPAGPSRPGGRGGNKNRGAGSGQRGNGRSRFFRGRWSYVRGRGRGRGGSNNSNDNSSNENNDQEEPSNTRQPSRSRSGNSNRPRSSNNNAPRTRNSDSDDEKPRRQPAIDKVAKERWRKTYPGYDIYFPTHPLIPHMPKKLDGIVEFLERNYLKTQKEILKVEEKEFFDLILDEILKDDKFIEVWPSFSTDLDESPRDTLNLWGLAVHQVVLETLSKVEEENSQLLTDDEGNPILVDKSMINVPFIRVGIMKVDPVVPLKAIKASLLGKLITIRGAIVRSGLLRPLCIRQTFRCLQCREITVCDQPEGRYTFPQMCSDPDCNNKKQFEPILSASTTKVIEYRRIRIQDVEHSHLEHGRIPRTIDCDLFYDLVNQCNAGDVITLCGIVKMTKDAGRHEGDQSLHSLFIEVVAVRNHKDSERSMGGNWFSFSNKDYYAVKEIFESEKLFRLLVASLCPGIYGMELVKAGILLALFGGTWEENETTPRRADINILVVGDPGLGKSQLLKIVVEVAPRGVYICGTGSTTAGLTVTLVREGDEYSLEAGALVMADKGICCIDEFDKMQSQHSALLEAMEQQCISIAKAGVFRTIPARTTVLAAANPVAGHYDNAKTVTENIRISAPLLSRFDLTFILQDRPDKKLDRSIMEHITGFRRASGSASAPEINPTSGNTDASNESLFERLKFHRGESVDLIPHILMRKYIAYAKQYVHPKISPEAAEIIQEYYLDLRKNHRTLDSTPVTTRQLESLVRLTQARAKAELRELATVEDARDVLEIFRFSMKGVFDEDNEVTLGFTQDVLNQSARSDLTPSASRSLSRNMAKRLAATLEQKAESLQKNIFTVDEIREFARSMGIQSGFERLIDVLNNDGFLLKKGARVYQFVCAN